MENPFRGTATALREFWATVARKFQKKPPTGELGDAIANLDPTPTAFSDLLANADTAPGPFGKRERIPGTVPGAIPPGYAVRLCSLDDLQLLALAAILRGANQTPVIVGKAELDQLQNIIARNAICEEIAPVVTDTCPCGFCADRRASVWEPARDRPAPGPACDTPA